MEIGRRNFSKIGALVAVGATKLGGVVCAAEAHKLGMPLKVFSEEESITLSSLAEKLVLGSTEAGVVNFIDYQLSVDPNDCMLLAKYFQVKPPYVNFYRAGLKALNEVCIAQYDRPFNVLKDKEMDSLITRLFDGSISDWQGPPASLFYLLVRSDAVDVSYGTPEGFKKLSIPYMAHILPPKGWGQK